MYTKQHSIAEARKNLPKLVREAESGKTVELTRHGQRVAVVIGQNEYERLVSRSQKFSRAWDAFRREVDLEELNIDPDEVFADVRDQSPGRDSGL